jgi:hypothetical protein
MPVTIRAVAVVNQTEGDHSIGSRVNQLLNTTSVEEDSHSNHSSQSITQMGHPDWAELDNKGGIGCHDCRPDL